MDRSYGLYVIEIHGVSDWVYVGYSWWPPEERLEQHLNGYNAAWVFKRGNSGRLRPDLYEHLPRYWTRAAAEKAEAELAQELRGRGFIVGGGH